MKKKLIIAIIIIAVVVIALTVHTSADEKIQGDGMPCCNQEAFAKWEEWRELQTSEESIQEEVWIESETSSGYDHQSDKYCSYNSGSDLYNITKLPIPSEIAEYLNAELSAAGIEWWYPYAVAQIWQESRCNAAAESPDGFDKGILQYRLKFWPATCEKFGYPEDTSIFDWRVQISIYVQQTANRLNNGYSVAETVSRHKQSDWGPYDNEYVQQVFQWVRIPNSCDWDAAYEMGWTE